MCINNATITSEYKSCIAFLKLEVSSIMGHVCVCVCVCVCARCVHKGTSITTCEVFAPPLTLISTISRIVCTDGERTDIKQFH